MQRRFVSAGTKPAAALPAIAPALATALEDLYQRLNRPEFIRPDPLQVVHEYRDPRDQELVGLIAASLAFGRVAHILASIGKVLGPMGPSPRRYLLEAAPHCMAKDFAGFQHRYVREAELLGLLGGTARALRNHGSLGACYCTHLRRRDATPQTALVAFAAELRGGAGPAPPPVDEDDALPPMDAEDDRRGRRSYIKKRSCVESQPDKRRQVQGVRVKNYLLPDPAQGSACKRLHLYLRWMVRNDAVDPGCWRHVAPNVLVVPLDTHMHRIARALGLTRRKQADARAAAEITAAFRTIAPTDPVRYDFALTRLGIRRDTALSDFLCAFG